MYILKSPVIHHGRNCFVYPYGTRVGRHGHLESFVNFHMFISAEIMSDLERNVLGFLYLTGQRFTLSSLTSFCFQC